MKAAAIEVRAREAIEELRGIRCPDPAAADAIDAVSLTVLTLEQWWLPELSRLTSGV